jgi:hypothetical protein
MRDAALAHNADAARLEAAASALRNDAQAMLDAYRDGLPAFSTQPAEGARCGTLANLILHARLTQPPRLDAADELEIQLRLLAVRRRREAACIEQVACVHEIGRRLYALTQALALSDDEQWREADAWARALNRMAGQAFQVFLATSGERFDAELMQGGRTNVPVRRVLGWGITDPRGAVIERAIIA